MMTNDDDDDKDFKGNDDDEAEDNDIIDNGDDDNKSCSELHLLRRQHWHMKTFTSSLSFDSNGWQCNSKCGSELCLPLSKDH